MPRPPAARVAFAVSVAGLAIAGLFAASLAIAFAADSLRAAWCALMFLALTVTCTVVATIASVLASRSRTARGFDVIAGPSDRR